MRIQFLLESTSNTNEKEDEEDLSTSNINSPAQIESSSQTSSINQYFVQSQPDQQRQHSITFTTSPSSSATVLLRKRSATNSAASERLKWNQANKIAGSIDGFESQLINSTVMN